MVCRPDRTRLLAGLFVPVLWLWLCLWPSGPAKAEADEAAGTTIDLVIVGPGDALFTRGGHVALLVTERDEQGRVWTHAYNFGDADFDDPSIPWNFVRGELPFFLSEVGDEYDLAEYYGLLQDRDVVRYPVALMPDKAQALADELKRLLLPDNRYYNHHYLESTCATKARDLLNMATGGAIARQLGDRDPLTPRAYQQLVFDDHLLVSLAADLFFGRLHDAPITRYYALLWPPRMPEYLAEVRVPDPAGGAQPVPLLGPPTVMASRGGESAPRRRSRVTWYVAGVFLVFGLGGGIALSRHPSPPRRRAAAWLVAWALPSGLAGTAMVAMELLGAIPQMRANELVLSLLFTDLLLVVAAIGWWRRGVQAATWLRLYAWVRVVVTAAAVVGRAVGLLIQTPLAVPIASLGCALGLWWLLRRVAQPPDDAAP